jgi:CheY-like chemotaxis protein
LKSVPEPHDRDEPVSVRLKPGAGFMRPDGLPARRNRDRAGVDDRRLLLVSLGGSHGADLETWARAAFTADVVSEPFDAVAHIQGIGYGAVLVHAPRSRVREAISACRAMRPLTRAAIVFASDDAVRATDRIQILASGADDCVSGGIALPELDLRLRQAIASGARPLQNGNGAHGSSMTSLGSAPGLDGGRVPKDVFDAELERRAADPMLRFFCVLSVTSDVLDMGQLAEILARQVRFDEGDLVVADADRCVVLLQGAREAQLGPFVERLRSRLDQWGDHRSEGGNGVTVLSHPTQAAQIAALLGTPRAIRS